MPIKLHFEIRYPDEKPLKRALVVYERVNNLQPAFERMLPVLQNYTENYLARSGAYEGNPAFAPLSPRYAKWKAKRYPNAPILTRSGRLRQSLATLTNESIADASPDALTYGTKVPYALYHQHGTRKMPKRPPLKLSKPLACASSPSCATTSPSRAKTDNPYHPTPPRADAPHEHCRRVVWQRRRGEDIVVAEFTHSFLLPDKRDVPLILGLAPREFAHEDVPPNPKLDETEYAYQRAERYKQPYKVSTDVAGDAE